MPRVYIIPSESPNAFATGRNPEHAAVAATEGILRILSRKNWRVSWPMNWPMSRTGTSWLPPSPPPLPERSMLGSMLQWGAILGGGRSSDDGEGSGGLLGSLALAIIAPIAAMLVQMAVSRSREYLADETGARICGQPLALANALRKLHTAARRIPMPEARPASAHLFIVNPLTGGGLTALFSTHPPMEERIRRLEASASGH